MNTNSNRFRFTGHFQTDIHDFWHTRPKKFTTNLTLGNTSIIAASHIFNKENELTCGKAYLDCLQELKCIPADYDCSEQMLLRLGFVPQSSSIIQNDSYHDLLKYLGKTYGNSAAAVVLFRAKKGSSIGEYAAMIPDRSGIWSMQHVTLQVYRYIPSKVYLRFSDGKDHSKNPLKKNSLRKYSFKPLVPFDSTDLAVYDPVNPVHAANDCLIRAVAGLYGCSWDRAFEMLAQFTGYSTLLLNSHYVYAGMLEDSGLKKIDFQGTFGELCRTLQQSQSDETYRILADSDKHAVAILPEETNDGSITYRIHDIFNSSDMYCNGYWIYTASREQPLPEFRSAIPCAIEPELKMPTYEIPTHVGQTYSVGAKIHDPLYGDGKVLFVGSNNGHHYATVQFANPKRVIQISLD